MNINELITNRTEQLKREVGLALSLVECEQFVGSCVHGALQVKNIAYEPVLAIDEAFSEAAVSCSSCKWNMAKFDYKCSSCFYHGKYEQDTDC